MITMNTLPEGLARLREPHQPERLEAYAATLAQEGRPGNEDAFLIRGAPVPLLALADGAGAAEQAARRALRELERLVAAATIEEVASFRSWSGWFHAIDAALAGGGETTLIALVQLDGRLLGAGCGDSRAYLWDAEGRLKLLTEGCCKGRIGSGKIAPCAIHTPSAAASCCCSPATAPGRRSRTSGCGRRSPAPPCGRWPSSRRWCCKLPPVPVAPTT
jgi:hypothetical protein